MMGQQPILVVKYLLKQSSKVLLQLEPKSQYIAKAHASILSCFKHPNCLDVLSQMLQQSCNDIQIRLLITHINTYIKQQASTVNMVRKHDKTSMNNIFKDLIRIMDAKHAMKYNKMLSRVYGHFLHIPDNTSIRQSTAQQLCKEFLKSQNMSSVLNRINTLLQGNVQTTILRIIVAQILRPLSQRIPLWIGRVKEAIKMKQQSSFIEAVLQLQPLMQLFRMLHYKIDVDILPKMKIQLIEKQINKRIILGILDISLDDGYFMLNNKNQYASKINICKCYALDTLSNFIKIIIKKKAWGQQNLKQIIGVCKIVLEQLPLVLVKQYEINPSQFNDVQLFKSALKTIAMLIRLPSLFSRAIAVRDALVYKLCLPLLRPQDDNSAVSDYIAIRQDIVQFHELHYISNAAAKVIQSYAEVVDGCLTNLCNTSCQIIKINVINLINLNNSRNGLQQIKYENEQYFKNIIKCLLQKKFKQHMQIQCCLTVLNNISFVMGKRRDLQKQIQQLFHFIQPFFISNEIEASTLFYIIQTYSFYTDTFHKLIVNDNIDSNFHIRFMTFCCRILAQNGVGQKLYGYKQFDSKDSQLCILTAIDCLNNALTSKDAVEAIYHQPTIVDIFAFLCKTINSSYNIKIIDILTDVFIGNIRKYYKKQPKKLPQILSAILSSQIAIIIIRALQQAIFYEKDVLQLNHAGMKMLSLLRLIIFSCDSVIQIFNLSISLFSKLLQTDSMWDIVALIDVAARRKDMDHALLFQIVLDNYNIFQKHRQFGKMFGIIITLLMNQSLQIHVYQIAQKTIQLFSNMIELNNQSYSFQEKLYDMISKSSYILLCVIYRYFNIVSPLLPFFIATIVKELRLCSKKKNLTFSGDDHFGKLCAIFCIYLQNSNNIPQNGNFLAQSNMYQAQTDVQFVINNVFSCEILNENTQVRIFCLESCKILQKNKNQQWFLLVCQLCYRITRKKNQNAHEDQCQDSQQSEREYWQQNQITTENNTFLKELKDPIQELKNLCHLYNHQFHQQFVLLIESFPKQVKVFVKDIVMFYNKSARKLVKVKRQ